MASFIKLKISSGIFSWSSNRICFSSSYQFRVRYWTPMLSQWLVSCMPAVLTTRYTLLEMMNSRSWAPYSSQMKRPSLILMTPTRLSSSRSSACWFGALPTGNCCGGYGLCYSLQFSSAWSFYPLALWNLYCCCYFYSKICGISKGSQFINSKSCIHIFWISNFSWQNQRKCRKNTEQKSLPVEKLEYNYCKALTI